MFVLVVVQPGLTQCISLPWSVETSWRAPKASRIERGQVNPNAGVIHEIICWLLICCVCLSIKVVNLSFFFCLSTDDVLHRFVIGLRSRKGELKV